MKLWKLRVREVYDSLNELEHYDSIYNIASRCGYVECSELWSDNPLIQGSVYPGDFGLAIESNPVSSPDKL